MGTWLMTPKKISIAAKQSFYLFFIQHHIPKTQKSFHIKITGQDTVNTTVRHCDIYSTHTLILEAISAVMGTTLPASSYSLQNRFSSMPPAGHSSLSLFFSFRFPSSRLQSSIEETLVLGSTSSSLMTEATFF